MVFIVCSRRDWWEDGPDVHGDVHIYTREDTPDGASRWIEFRVRFTNGRVQEVRELEKA